MSLLLYTMPMTVDKNWMFGKKKKIPYKVNFVFPIRVFEAGTLKHMSLNKLHVFMWIRNGQSSVCASVLSSVSPKDDE